MFKWVALSITLMLTNPVVAQESIKLIPKPVICGPHTEITEKINEAGETNFEYLGMYEAESDKNVQVVFSIYRNLKNKTFTIMETSISGVSCIIGGGIFEDVKEGPKL
jgi:hypothetical protein|tara:strand:- start:651 stop:974 length:324 start_codon:yes stop_codon:yes gene_type:complete